MKMAALKNKAIALGIQPGKLKKTELIHAIQRAEGYTPCFGFANPFPQGGGPNCPYTDCCFRDDCLKINSSAVRHPQVDFVVPTVQKEGKIN